MYTKRLRLVAVAALLAPLTASTTWADAAPGPLVAKTSVTCTGPAHMNFSPALTTSPQDSTVTGSNQFPTCTVVQQNAVTGEQIGTPETLTPASGEEPFVVEVRYTSLVLSQGQCNTRNGKFRGQVTYYWHDAVGGETLINIGESAGITNAGLHEFANRDVADSSSTRFAGYSEHPRGIVKPQVAGSCSGSSGVTAMSGDVTITLTSPPYVTTVT
ncbi:hypothetical protein [Streptomyces sp. NPDC049590]|uniref:hypothetical protein n=1 Tax=Streptomyces sp. NPDC049590 TaxID=3154834 RepID=UPI0034492908